MAASPPPTAPPRMVSRGSTRSPVLKLGLRRNPLRDFYHFWLTTAWPGLVAIIIGGYVGVNALFALAYLALGDSIESARPGSFADAFFFSVQTMATIGYGKMVPRTFGANALVSLEALCGLLGFSMVTGLIFSKFARPTSRVLFSKIAVISERDGVPSLMFRLANERSNQIIDVNLKAVLARNETTAEGEQIRRFHRLQLSRDWAALFSLTWTAIHPITPESPLFGLTRADIDELRAEIFVIVSGVDETFSQTIHARFSYIPEDIVWNRRFTDVLTRLPDGGWQIDYRRFHEATVADEPA